MFRLSSNTTLFWKLFFPTFYITFFGILILVSFQANPNDIPLLSNVYVKSAMLVMYVSFITLMWFTIMNLKRVEADQDHIFVTNYYNTFRYMKSDIESINTRDLSFFKVTTLTMKEATKMGKKIRFLGDYTVSMK
jgi:hypothetical protein